MPSVTPGVAPATVDLNVWRNSDLMDTFVFTEEGRDWSSVQARFTIRTSPVADGAPLLELSTESSLPSGSVLSKSIDVDTNALTIAPTLLRADRSVSLFPLASSPPWQSKYYYSLVFVEGGGDSSSPVWEPYIQGAFIMNEGVAPSEEGA